MTIRFVLFLVLVALPYKTQAAVEIASLFRDNAVLQRDAAVPLWGTAEAGEAVTVSFAGQEVTTKADKDGNWRVELKSLSASAEPRSLAVTSDRSDKRLTIKNVLVGDVWVGSGQSNMAGKVASYAKNDETLAKLAGEAPFAQLRLMQSGPTPTWTEATSVTVAQFSAIHFAFGERLQRDLDVPIGLIVGAVGGTPSGYWIPPATFDGSDKCKAEIAEFAKTWNQDVAEKQYADQFAAWEKRVAAAKAKGEKPRGRAPVLPKGPGGSIRGGKIGGLYERFIEPVVGYRIRGVLWDQGEAGSGVLGVDQYTMMSELMRGWREVWGQGDFPFLFVQKPSGGGCAFSNDNSITRNGDAYTGQLPDISRIGSGEQRFLYVRLMHDNPNAWMVPASDLGSGIHPTNKWGYGNRAADVALGQVYKKDVQAYGPIYTSHKIAGGKVVVQFDQVGKGLIAAHGSKLKGFALASDDGQWHWAEARIEGDNVVLSSDKVTKPTRIRYAFSQNRQWANLFNKDGLPALAFEAGE